MKAKKLIALLLTVVMTLSLAACGAKPEAQQTEAAPKQEAAKAETPVEALPKYADIKIGEEYTDLTADIAFFHNRTDMDNDGRMDAYIAEFNKLYPNIKVKQTSSTNYDEDTLLRLSTGDWGDIMFLRTNVEAIDFEQFFMPWGTVEELDKDVNYANGRAYNGISYGMPFFGKMLGVIYNKRVFQEAGVKEWPTTPEEFHNALVAIRDNTEAIPMYTNYADSWPINDWNGYRNLAVGEENFDNDKMYHTENPFADPGDGTGLYNLYKILWDAVADDCTEEDYTTTDWEGGKTMLCNGDIGCMFLGSWYYVQAAGAGDHPEDLAYGPLPMTVNGKQCIGSSDNNYFAVNKNSSDANKLASMIFVKWMCNDSTFCDDELVVPAVKGASMPAFLNDIADLPVIYNRPVAQEDLEMARNMKNATMGIENHYIIEAADSGADTFDNIMDNWNQIWSDAQQSVGVEVNR